MTGNVKLVCNYYHIAVRDSQSRIKKAKNCPNYKPGEKQKRSGRDCLYCQRCDIEYGD